MHEPDIYINHIGFLCRAQKTIIVKGKGFDRFEVQDMGKVAQEQHGVSENWEKVFEGELKEDNSHLGSYLIGDFSAIRKPGQYRVVLPDLAGWSYPFIISDGAFSRLPGMLLDFVHERRSGEFENGLRTFSHLDDAIRSDNGEQIDVSGGWYDAGDLRKWMTTCMLPALGFMDLIDRLQFQRAHFSEEKVAKNDLVTETIWGVKFILKMQDQLTGMFFESIGGGGDSRKTEGMSWWYENHSGCYADNSDNRFTDNIAGSGDERTVRVEYNPIVQYVCMSILARAESKIRQSDGKMANQIRQALKKGWKFVENARQQDPLHHWTSVRSWRLICSLEQLHQGQSHSTNPEHEVEEILAAQDGKTGFWTMSTDSEEPYRGIVHAAQPLIALSRFLEIYPLHGLADQIKEALMLCATRYIFPLVNTNPFRIMPYGLFNANHTEGDLYREVGEGLNFRFFMPDCSPQKINHGLGGHWTSWAHALALMGKVLQNADLKNLAWAQLYWLLGNNPLHISFISGLGYHNPVPHSRFHGTIPGGFMVGPRGNERDEMVVDTKGACEWNSTEYWNVPAANAMMALSLLLPLKIYPDTKLG